MNLILLRDGWPPVIIGPEHRPDYLDALEARQLDGNIAPYTAFMEERLSESIDRYLEAISKELEARPAGPGRRP
jgi:hypothetical protein